MPKIVAVFIAIVGGEFTTMGLELVSSHRAQLKGMS